MATNGIFVTTASTVRFLTFSETLVPFFDLDAGTYPIATLIPKEGDGQPEVTWPISSSVVTSKILVWSRAGGPF